MAAVHQLVQESHDHDTACLTAGSALWHRCVPAVDPVYWHPAALHLVLGVWRSQHVEGVCSGQIVGIYWIGWRPITTAQPCSTAVSWHRPAQLQFLGTGLCNPVFPREDACATKMPRSSLQWPLQDRN